MYQIRIGTSGRPVRGDRSMSKSQLPRTDTDMSTETTWSEEEYVDQVQIKALRREIKSLQQSQQFFENEEAIAALKKRVNKLKLKGKENGETAGSQRSQRV